MLEPTIGNYFRNSAQVSDVITFLGNRKERQESARLHIGGTLCGGGDWANGPISGLLGLKLLEEIAKEKDTEQSN